MGWEWGTGGNQRESDREKAQKKLAGQNKPKESGNSLKARQEANGEIMRAKQVSFYCLFQPLCCEINLKGD